MFKAGAALIRVQGNYSPAGGVRGGSASPMVLSIAAKAAVNPFEAQVVAHKGIDEAADLTSAFRGQGEIAPQVRRVFLHFAQDVKGLVPDGQGHAAAGTAIGATGHALGHQKIRAFGLVQRAAAEGTGGQIRGIALIRRQPEAKKKAE